jgi:hypothetical protein
MLLLLLCFLEHLLHDNIYDNAINKDNNKIKNNKFN